MKMVSVLLFFAVLVAGCASSRSPYRSRNTDIGSAALKGFVAGTRGLLEGRAEARKKRQLRDALISDSIRTLGAPDKVLSDSGSIVYYWENLTIGVVIQHLGTPDGTKSDKPDNSLSLGVIYLFRYPIFFRCFMHQRIRFLNLTFAAISRHADKWSHSRAQTLDLF